MPLTFPPPPSDATATLTRSLAARGIASKGGPGALSTLRPIPSYALPVDRLDDGYEAAVLESWLCLLVEGGEIGRAARLVASADGSCRVAGLSSSADGMAAALSSAARVAEKHDYEIRILSVPPLPLTALWLKDVAVGDDRFLIVPPVPPFVAEVDRVYSSKELLSLLQDRGRGGCGKGPP